MNPAATSEDTIVQEITIKAPAGRIFAALTNPKKPLSGGPRKESFELLMSSPIFGPEANGRCA